MPLKDVMDHHRECKSWIRLFQMQLKDQSLPAEVRRTLRYEIVRLHHDLADIEATMFSYLPASVSSIRSQINLHHEQNRMDQ